MNMNEIINNSRFFKALRKSKYFKKCNHWNIISGRFDFLPRFTMLQNYLLESLYIVNDLHNPSAFRLYLYLVRNITGYKNRSSVEFRPKKLKAQMNMGNNFYKAVKCLEEKNMVHYEFKNGIKYNGLNPLPKSWNTKSIDRIDEILDNEINELLEREKGVLRSSSSSSWSSSSSSSMSYPSNTDSFLLRELDTL